MGGRIKTLAQLMQTLDNESYEATCSKPFVIYISIPILKNFMSIYIRTGSYMVNAIGGNKNERSL